MTVARFVTPLHSAVLALVVALLVWGAQTPGFFTWDNLKAVLSNAAVTGIVAVGMAAIMVAGSLVSLALGITAAVCAIAFMYLLAPLGLVGAIAVTVALGLVITGLQGIAVGGWQANPIVVTIAAGAVMQGVTTSLTGSAQISSTSTSFEVLASTPAGIPIEVFVAIGFMLLVELLQRKSTLGRESFLVGTSRAAARAAGLPLARIGLAVFGVAGCSAAVAGILLASQNRQGSFLLGTTLTFDAIAAALVGGVSVNGGHGSAWRSLAGAFVIASISDLLLLNSFDTSVQVLIEGLLVTAAVLVLNLRSRDGRRR